MDASLALAFIWATVGAAAGTLVGCVRRNFWSCVLDGMLGGCVTGSLFFKLRVGLPYHAGTMVAAAVGAVAFVFLLDQFRSLDGGAGK